MMFTNFAVVPVLIGPLQVLIAIAPAIFVSVAGVILTLLKPSSMKRFAQLLWRMKFTLIPVVLLIVAACHWLPDLFRSTGSVGEAELSDQNWNMFRGCPARLGAAPGATGPLKGGVNWVFDSDVKTFYSSPTVVGNRIYITSADKGISRDSGAIYCLDADTGGIVWKTEPAKYRATFSSPSVQGNRLVCGEGLHFTQNARVFCLDLSEEGQGKVLWSFETKSHVESSPAIYDGKVYIGAGGDGYYCLALDGDGAGGAKVLWHVKEGYPDAETCPTVSDGKVFVGLGMGGNAVCCLDAESGRELWRVETPYPVFSPPTLADGRVIIGMGNGNFIETAEAVRTKELQKMSDAGASALEIQSAESRLGPAGEVWSICIDRPEDRWVYNVPRTILGAVMAVDDRLFFGSRDGFFYSISQTGEFLGKWNAYEPIAASPAYADGVVYFITSTGKIHALNPDTLEARWSYTVGADGLFISSPAIARGRLYVGSEANGLLSIGEPLDENEKEKPIWAGHLGGPGRGGVLNPGIVPTRGSMLWCHPKTASGETPPLFAGAPAILGKHIYLPVSQPLSGLLCLQNTEDSTEKTAERWFAPTAHPVTLSPAASEQTVYCVDGTPGETGRKLYAFSAASGKESWTTSVEPEASGCVLLTSESLFVADQKEGLSRISLTGEKEWSRSVGNVPFTPSLKGSILTILENSGNRLLALDAFCGKTLWEIPLYAEPTAAPVIDQKIVYNPTAKGIVARNLLDGSTLWKADVGSVGELALGIKEIVCISESGELLVIDKASGEVIDRIDGVHPATPPVRVKNQIFFVAGDYIDLYNIQDQSRENWMKVSWLGELKTPIIMENSRLYFATEKYGLIRAGSRK